MKNHDKKVPKTFYELNLFFYSKQHQKQMYFYAILFIRERHKIK